MFTFFLEHILKMISFLIVIYIYCIISWYIYKKKMLDGNSDNFFYIMLKVTLYPRFSTAKNKFIIKPYSSREKFTNCKWV